jgi:hypothetical protein
VLLAIAIGGNGLGAHHHSKKTGNKDRLLQRLRKKKHNIPLCKQKLRVSHLLKGMVSRLFPFIKDGFVKCSIAMAECNTPVLLVGQFKLAIYGEFYFYKCVGRFATYCH